MNRFRTILALSVFILAGLPALADPPPAGNRVRPVDFFIEPPTLNNLGFEWRVDGDDNRTASVQVFYRQKGDRQWKQGMDLFRLQGERTLENVRFDVISPNMFAGSIIDLQPDTEYECLFVLRDPDGVLPAVRRHHDHGWADFERSHGWWDDDEDDYRYDPRKNEVSKLVTVRTRPEPRPYAGVRCTAGAPGCGRVFHVYPYGTPNDKKVGTPGVDSFEGLLEAYNNSASGTDMTMATRPRVRAGDTIFVHAGVYKYHPEFYTNTASLSRVAFDGTYFLHGTGTAEKPIAIVGAGDGEVVFDGNGTFNLFDVKLADYHYFEGITFRNTELAIWAGQQFGPGAKGLTVKHCRFEGFGFGIYTNSSRSSNFYIADNTFIGRNDPAHIISWSDSSFSNILRIPFPPSMGRPSIDTANGTWLDSLLHVPYAPQFQYGSYMAVKTYGPGHVFAYNYVANVHDGIDDETYGNPDGSFASDAAGEPDTTNGPKYPPPAYWDRRPVALDWIGNYMTNFHDNPFEADGSMHNVRFLRNYIVNTASHGYCNQPTLGGPIYWIRNIQYKAPGGSTRGEATGAIFINNTTVSETAPARSANVHWVNNLMLGANGSDRLFNITSNTNYSSSDYNGFRPNPTPVSPCTDTSQAGCSFGWNTPDFSVVAITPTPDAPNPTLVNRGYATLGAYSAATGQDTHSILVDYDVFVNVPRYDMRNNPADKTTVIDPAALGVDFSLRAGSAAIDKGTSIPNVTDDYTGAGPDLGALEYGRPLPHWGPRN